MEEIREKKETSMFNIFDLKNISTEHLKEDRRSKTILEEYNIKNYQQLEDLVNTRKITDYYLASAVIVAKERFDFTLEDILVDALRVNKQADLILKKYNITNFEQLEAASNACVYAIISNKYLVHALKVVKKVLEEIKQNNKSRK